MSVPQKHIKTLARRLKFLEQKIADGKYNSFDQAEVLALSRVLEELGKGTEVRKDSYHLEEIEEFLP